MVFERGFCPNGLYRISRPNGLSESELETDPSADETTSEGPDTEGSATQLDSEESSNGSEQTKTSN